MSTIKLDANGLFEGFVEATQFKSTIAQGTAPLIVGSTTKVNNLNSNLLEGYNASAFAKLNSNNTFTGTLIASNLSGTNTGDQDLSGYALLSALTNVAYTNVDNSFVPQTINTLGGASNLATAVSLAAIKTDYNGNPGIGTFFGAITNGGGVYQYIQSSNTNNSSAGHLVLNPYGGRVGIGTTAPTEKLDVVGNGLFSGTVTHADATLNTQSATLGQVNAAFSEIAIPSLQDVVNVSGYLEGIVEPWVYATLDGDGLYCENTFSGVDSVVTGESIRVQGGTRNSPDAYGGLYLYGVKSKSLGTGVVSLTTINRTDVNPLELNFPDKSGTETLACLSDLTGTVGGLTLNEILANGSSAVDKTIYISNTAGGSLEFYSSGQIAVYGTPGNSMQIDLTGGAGGRLKYIQNGFISRIYSNTLTADRDIYLPNGNGTLALASDVTNNYLTGVSGSGDGTVTFTRAGLGNLTWNSAHSHAEYLTSYTETDPIFSASPSAGIIAQDITNWDQAFNDYIIGVAVTGTNTKTLTLTQRDGGVVTTTWTDLDTPPDGDEYIDALSFEPTTGILSAGRTGALPDITASLDGRYSLLGHGHIISDITGLQTALNGKVDDSQVLTNVPAGAVFTDTVYNDTTIQAEVDLNTDKISFDSTSSTRLANTSGTNTGDQDLSGLSYVKQSVGNLADADANIIDGYHATSATWVGSPFPGTDGTNQGYLKQHNWTNNSSSYVEQHWQNINGTYETKYRRKNNGTWSSWYNIYTSANFVADTDYQTPQTTLSGYGITDAYTQTQSDAKYLLNTTDKLSGDLTIEGTLLLKVSSTNIALQRADSRVDNTNFARAHWYGNTNTGSNSNARHAFYTGAKYINVDAENDGLTIDGVNGSSFITLGGGSADARYGINWGFGSPSNNIYSQVLQDFNDRATKGLQFNTQSAYRFSFNTINNVGTYVDNLVTILGTGNVGIGTTSPNSKLDIGGVTSSLHLNSDGDLSTIASRSFDGTSAKWLLLNPDGGNVGIGTVSPNSLLNVAQSGVTSTTISTLSANFGGGVLSATASTFSELMLEASGGGGGYTARGSVRAYFGREDYAGSKLGFFIRDASFGSLTEKMTIDSTGNVGIGTTSPAAKLDIKTTDSINALRILNSNNINGFSMTSHTTQGSYFQAYDAAGVQSIMIDARTDSSLRHSYFMGGGNVGIGTVNPSTKLEVNGDIGIGRVAGGYTFREVVGGGLRASMKSNSLNELIFSIGADTEAMRIDSSRNVGIGTPSPDKNLTIKTNGAIGFKYNTVDATDSFHTITGGGTNPMSFSVTPFSANTPIFTFNGNAGNVMTILNGGSMSISGTFTAGGDVNMGGTVLKGDNKNIIQYSDAWLRINPNNQFTSGIYCSAGILRTDGTLQVGANGDSFKASSVDVVSGVPIKMVADHPVLTLYDTGGVSNLRRSYQGINNGEYYHNIANDAGTWIRSGYVMSLATGAITFASTVSATDFIGTSDKRLKENIEVLTPKKINTVYKSFNMIGNEQERVGVIAQELEIENPEFIRTDDKGMKSVSYSDLHSAEIAYLKKENEELKAKLELIMNKLGL